MSVVAVLKSTCWLTENCNIPCLTTSVRYVCFYRLAEKKDKKKLRLPVTSLQTLYDKLVPLTPEQRMDTFSLKADRADVIVPAAEIFLTIAKVVRSEYIHVPVIGLADGIIDSLYENKEGEN